MDYFVCNRRFAFIIKKWVCTAKKSASLGGSVVLRKKTLTCSTKPLEEKYKLSSQVYVLTN